jgi:signal peptidase I
MAQDMAPGQSQKNEVASFPVSLPVSQLADVGQSEQASVPKLENADCDEFELHRPLRADYNLRMANITVDERLTFPPQADQAAQHSTASLPRPRLTSRRSLIREAFETVLLIVSIYCLVNLATARYVVEGASMAPNFGTDQFIIVSRIAYLLGSPARGDVVVFHNPQDPAHDFIKRVIGLPGEKVQILDGKVYINGAALDEPYVAELCKNQACDRTWTMDGDHFFVLGDNRNHSHDSHSFGPLDRSLIIGKAWVRYWPPPDWSLIPHYDYGSLRFSSSPMPVN